MDLHRFTLGSLSSTTLKAFCRVTLCAAAVTFVTSACDAADDDGTNADAMAADSSAGVNETSDSEANGRMADAQGGAVIAWPGSTPADPGPTDEDEDARDRVTPEDDASTGSEVDSALVPDPPVRPGPTEPEEWREDDPAWQCANGTPVSTLVEFVIPGREAGCGWSEGDKLAPTQGAFAGYQRDVSVVDLPGNSAAICGVNMDFASYLDDYAQPFLYDDHFILTFADVVLLSSYADIVDSLEEVESGMRIYDWTPIAGSSMSFNNGYAYCLGYGQTDTVDCQIPASESNGAMAYSIGGPIADVLSERAIASQNATFSIITFGDNDNDTDCRHSEVRFRALVDYVLRP